MIDTSVTVKLPEEAFEQLQSVARRQHRSVHDVVQDLVLRELPGLPPLPQNVEEELAAFSSLSDDVLWMLARSTLTKDQQRELANLNAEAQRRPFPDKEKDRQQALLEAYDRVLVRRARAAALLKARGYDLSDPAVLQTPSA